MSFGVAGQEEMKFFFICQKYCDEKSTKSTVLVNDILIDSTERTLQGHEIKKRCHLRVTSDCLLGSSQTFPCYVQLFWILHSFAGAPCP